MAAEAEQVETTPQAPESPPEGGPEQEQSLEQIMEEVMSSGEWEDDAPAPQQEAPPQPEGEPQAAAEQPTAAPAEGPRNLPDEDEGQEPIRPQSLRERLLENQTKEPLQQQIQELQQRIQQQDAREARQRQLISEGKYNEFLQATAGMDLTAIQRAELERRGAIPKESPEVAALRQQMERMQSELQRRDQQAARARQEHEYRENLKRQQEAVTQELKDSGYEDLGRLAEVEGFSGLVYESITSDPQTENTVHWRRARADYAALGKQIVGALWPDLLPQIEGKTSTPGTKTQGVTPGQPGASAAVPPGPQQGATPGQPGASVERTSNVLPQGGSADAGAPSFSSDQEEWESILQSVAGARPG